MEVDMAPIALADIFEDAERAFRQVAEQNGLEFVVEIDPTLPPSIVTDEQRLNQILKNLLSNAFKFTHKGGVTLAIGYPSDGMAFHNETLQGAERVISMTVTDTGVGIADDKLGAIFEAFQQADGTTSRKYGGTGLGLSISREIARLLGGEIQVESQLGTGSRFSLLLPLNERLLEPAPQAALEGALDVAAPTNGGTPATPEAPSLPADEAVRLEPDDRLMLVIDPDSERAREAVEAARLHGVKSIIARRPTAALGLAREHRPSAVLLGGGWARVEPALGQLKKHPDTRHLPVVVISDSAARNTALRGGAAAFIDEPVDPTRLETRARAARAADADAAPADRRDHRADGARRSAQGAGGRRRERGVRADRTRARRSPRCARSRSIWHLLSSAPIQRAVRVPAGARDRRGRSRGPVDRVRRRPSCRRPIGLASTRWRNRP